VAWVLLDSRCSGGQIEACGIEVGYPTYVIGTALLTRLTRASIRYMKADLYSWEVSRRIEVAMGDLTSPD
jgi:hypothetical protein